MRHTLFAFVMILAVLAASCLAHWAVSLAIDARHAVATTIELRTN